MLLICSFADICCQCEIINCSGEKEDDKRLQLLVGSVFRGAKTSNFADVELEGQIKVSESRAGSNITACFAFWCDTWWSVLETQPYLCPVGQDRRSWQAAQDDIIGRH